MKDYDEPMNDQRSIKIHTEADFDGMRKAGRLAAETMDYIIPFVKPGVTTDELNTLCHDFIIDHGATPSLDP